jgi:(1->4)-alpha-D-glucan 1-alpha-D-glucosylmutase
MRVPTSTYRVQLHRDFGFEQARKAVAYLHALGVMDLYSSPIYAARSGSQHGYDVVDHERVNPELGGEDGLRGLAKELAAHAMGMLLDIVPNHMCVAGDANRRWLDVLENGPSAESASFFDIDWSPPKPELAGRVLLPILPDQFGRVLVSKELAVVYRPEGFAVGYAGAELPLAPGSWDRVLAPALGVLRGKLGEGNGEVLELESILRALARLPVATESSPDRVRERRHELPIIKQRIAALRDNSDEFRRALDETLLRIGGQKGVLPSFDALADILTHQSFRLSYWRVAAHEINYRRFFDINDLAAIRVENPEVFEAVHSLPFRLAKEGLVTGLRIDHVDGLYDPLGYLIHLQRSWRANTSAGAPSDGAYVVVEKILGSGEALPSDWPVAGTTGYEFMNLATGVFVDRHRGSRLRTIADRPAGSQGSFSSIAYECKKLILRTSLVAELTVLAKRLDRISEQDMFTRDFTRFGLQEALAEVIACFPVYRTYVRPDSDEATAVDRGAIELAVGLARRRNPVMHDTMFDFLRSVLLLEGPEGLTVEQQGERRDFVMRFQQLTGPVMAKGVEDTAFYRYFPLAALEEVGANPAALGASVDQFHDRMVERARSGKKGLSATDTHDAKRSEDVRARLAVLSEIPEEWDAAVDRWRALNDRFKTALTEIKAPDDDDEYLFYQTVLGIWQSTGADDAGEFTKRVSEYMAKAVHEAKRHSSWINPNRAYDDAVGRFVAATLDPRSNRAFLNDLSAFARRVERPGYWNSLSQLLLKLAAPGVPDFYQGSELWSFHLVDPDNRRLVDFEDRQRRLGALLGARERDPIALVAELLRVPENGAIKMFVTAVGLRYRRANAALFLESDYVPCEVRGSRSSQIIAFARRTSEKTVIAVAGRFYTRLGAGAQLPLGHHWADTYLAVPAELRSATFREVFTGRRLVPSQANSGLLAMDRVFEGLPIALIEAQ